MHFKDADMMKDTFIETEALFYQTKKQAFQRFSDSRFTSAQLTAEFLLRTDHFGSQELGKSNTQEQCFTYNGKNYNCHNTQSYTQITVDKGR